MKLFRTAERVSPDENSDNYIFQRSLFAYLQASRIIHGNVLEIGTGCGYGIEYLSSESDYFTTVDKVCQVEEETISKFENVHFMQVKVPVLKNLPKNHYDFVVMFQLIEHIAQDSLLLKEVHRVLRKNGVLILTTPNKAMSLTRNPWHVREYSSLDLDSLLSGPFEVIARKGVFGNQHVAQYYDHNKTSVEKITRYDVLDLQHRLPASLLRWPYDLFNRLNRKTMLFRNRELVKQISHADFFLHPVDDQCLDLFYMARKTG